MSLTNTRPVDPESQDATCEQRGRTSKNEKRRVRSILKRNQSTCLEKSKRSKTVTFDDNASHSEPEMDSKQEPR